MFSNMSFNVGSRKYGSTELAFNLVILPRFPTDLKLISSYFKRSSNLSLWYKVFLFHLSLPNKFSKSSGIDLSHWLCLFLLLQSVICCQNLIRLRVFTYIKVCLLIECIFFNLFKHYIVFLKRIISPKSVSKAYFCCLSCFRSVSINNSINLAYCLHLFKALPKFHKV